MFVPRKKHVVYLSLLFLLWTCVLEGQTVINRGMPGQNSLEVAERTAALLQVTKPSIVVLFVGMNDAVNEKKFLSPEQTRENILRVIRMAADSGATTVLVTVHAPDDARLLARHDPHVYGDRSPSQRVDAVNQVLLEVAHAQHIKVADFHSALQKAGGANAALSTDGVHLTTSGYTLLASTVRRALPSDLRDRTILCLGDSITYGIGVRAADSSQEGSDTYPSQLSRMLNASPGQTVSNPEP